MAQNQHTGLYQYIDFALWSRIHRLPRFFIEGWQRRELKRTLSNAYLHIPLYRKLMEEHHIRPQDIRTLDDMRVLPITSKRLFREYSVEEFGDKFCSRRGYNWKQTTGSTGEPFSFITNLRHHLWQRFGTLSPFIFYAYRFLLWKNFSIDDIKKRVKLVHIRNTDPKTKNLFITIAEMRQNTCEVIAKLKEYVPDVVESMPSVFAELGRFAERMPESTRPHFTYAVCQGEAISSEERKYIENMFLCELYNRYGLQETQDIAVECARHNGLHVYEESFIVEILDETNNSLPPGVQGRIVITHFHNDVMPFIRYDTGDTGLVMPGRCGCGIPSKRILVNGRGGVFLELGGKRFNHLEFDYILRYFSENIFRYQLAKIGQKTVELRIVPRGKLNEHDSELLLNKFREKVGFEPKLKLMEEIPYAPNGKTPIVVDETAAGRI